MNLKEAFAVAELLQAANSSTLADLASCSVLRKLKRGRRLYYERAEVPMLYILVSGTAALYKYTGNGEKRVLLVCGTGMALNEDIVKDCVASTGCEMLQDACVLCIPVERLLANLPSDFDLTKALLDGMAVKMRRMYRQARNTASFVRIDRRIAAKLWKLARDYGVDTPEGTRIELELTITYLADMLGAKRETVSRQVKQMGDSGLLLYQDKHFIIPDMEALHRYFM